MSKFKYTVGHYMEQLEKVSDGKVTWAHNHNLDLPWNGAQIVGLECSLHGKFDSYLYPVINGKSLPFSPCRKCGAATKSENMKKQNVISDLELQKSIVENDYGFKYVDDRNFVVALNRRFHCTKHGDFFSSVREMHLRESEGKSGCLECSLEMGNRHPALVRGIKNKISKKHGLRYQYLSPITAAQKVIIKFKCPVHGEQEQTIKDHLGGTGCPVCDKPKDLADYIKKHCKSTW